MWIPAVADGNNHRHGRGVGQPLQRLAFSTRARRHRAINDPAAATPLRRSPSRPISTRSSTHPARSSPSGFPTPGRYFIGPGISAQATMTTAVTTTAAQTRSTNNRGPVSGSCRVARALPSAREHGLGQPTDRWRTGRPIRRSLPLVTTSSTLHSRPASGRPLRGRPRPPTTGTQGGPQPAARRSPRFVVPAMRAGPRSWAW